MHRVFTLILLLAAAAAPGQGQPVPAQSLISHDTTATQDIGPPPQLELQPQLQPQLVLQMGVLEAAVKAHASPQPTSFIPTAPETPLADPRLPDSPLPDALLPDAPGSTDEQQQSVVALAEAASTVNGVKVNPCRVSGWKVVLQIRPPDDTHSSDTPTTTPCPNVLNPYARFLDTTMPLPMTPRQKGLLAVHDLLDPFNLGTIIAAAGFAIAIDSHSAFGPGLKGFGRLSGVSLSQDVTGEFFGTFLIPSLTREDPHYHRLPHASIPRRILHAASRTIIAQNDDGSAMPNYATLLTYPIASELSNLYVPGIQSNAESTWKRIGIGYALDPVNNLITEFLPDFAKRVHIRIIFVQQILNRVVAEQAGAPQQSSP